MKEISFAELRAVLEDLNYMEGHRGSEVAALLETPCQLNRIVQLRSPASEIQRVISVRRQTAQSRGADTDGMDEVLELLKNLDAESEVTTLGLEVASATYQLMFPTADMSKVAILRSRRRSV